MGPLHHFVPFETISSEAGDMGLAEYTNIEHELRVCSSSARMERQVYQLTVIEQVDGLEVSSC